MPTSDEIMHVTIYLKFSFIQSKNTLV